MILYGHPRKGNKQPGSFGSLDKKSNNRMSWFHDLVVPEVKSPHLNVQSPNGFKDTNTKKSTIKQKTNQLDDLKANKAWELAWAPSKQIPMTLFMSYMTGNSLQMIPITQTLMLFSGALSAIFSSPEQFKPLRTKKNSGQINYANIVFILVQLIVVAIGVYKLDSMGLIPNRRADWLSWEVPQKVRERVWN